MNDLFTKDESIFFFFCLGKWMHPVLQLDVLATQASQQRNFRINVDLARDVNGSH